MAKTQLFQTIRTEGAVLPSDVLQRIASTKVDGCSPDSFHLPPGTKVSEAIAESWSKLRSQWKAFQEARDNIPEPDNTGTTATNDRWLLQLFKELDYGRLATSKAPIIDERPYPIERFYNHTPIHLIGCKLPLDRRTKGARGAATSSPHSMVQEYLNRSDGHLWAFLSNGLQLRILRDNVSLSRQAFVEFDLEAMMEGEVYSDFSLLWLLCHQSRVEAEKPEECWLERWSQIARDEGTRVLKDLRIGVAKAIEALGRGFIGHPKNDLLREKLRSGELSTGDYYRQLLRTVYRLLFLFIAEDRELLHSPESSPAGRLVYDKYYSTRRLRELATQIRGSKHSDLWHSLSLIFDKLGRNEGCPELGLSGLGSFLWSASGTPDLHGPQHTESEAEQVLITNDDLLDAIRQLAYIEQDRITRIVDYRNLGSEELGSVYEALLELHPSMNAEGRAFELLSAAGNQRKLTGSYYTPDSLVQCLLDSALDPVVGERIKRKKGEEAERALLEMKVCDPACGSGHFLVAAAHRLARQLARVRTEESEPGPEEYQRALRDVIGKCIFGVDINPMSVELCKVSLWMEAIEPGKPLSFLDHHIQCGNSLLGTTPALIKGGIPDGAYKAITGDVKVICSQHRKDNKDTRGNASQGLLELEAAAQAQSNSENISQSLLEVEETQEGSINDIRRKEKHYSDLLNSSEYEKARLLADAWCAAFVLPKDESHQFQGLHSGTLRRIEEEPESVSQDVKREIGELAKDYQFLHWHLAFPQVFQRKNNSASDEILGWDGGFDCVLGNPPWERVKLQEKEWFTEREPEIANAPNAAKRKKLIKALETENPELWRSFQEALRKAEGESHIIRDSMRYPLCGRGDVNTYTIFAESMRQTMRPNGRAGFIVPSGIATDDTTKFYFQEIIEKNSLVSLYDFENREKIFPAVDSRMKFSLLTLTGPSSAQAEGAEFVFFAHKVDELDEPDRRFKLTSEEIELLNPNTRNCSIFRSRADAELTKAIYRRVPVLIKDAKDGQPEENPWGIKFKTMFHMANDSGLFRTREQLEQSGLTIEENVFRGVSESGGSGSEERWLPLFEGKMLWHFNHRFGDYSLLPPGSRSTQLPPVPVESLEDPGYFVLPRYWVNSNEVSNNIPATFHRPWTLGWRDITNTTNQRTDITCFAPVLGFGHKWLLIFSPRPLRDILVLCADNCSFAHDFVTRQKLGGTSLAYFTKKQITTVAIEQVSVYHNFLIQRVLELVYTSVDIGAFAEELNYNGHPFGWSEDRRFLIQCEIDAVFFHFYLPADAHGNWRIARKEDEAVVDETDEQLSELEHHFPKPRDAVAYIMETFPIVKRKDIARTEVKNDQGEVIKEGTYITKDTILEIYDEMQKATESGKPYKTRLDPPPGPPADADGNFIPMEQWDVSNWPSHIHQPKQ